MRQRDCRTGFEIGERERERERERKREEVERILRTREEEMLERGPIFQLYIRQIREPLLPNNESKVSNLSREFFEFNDISQIERAR
jgi:hypothetical protein